MDEVIRVKGLTKQFGQLAVLRGIDCTITASEVVCVIGPSGSGKSTFLRCLNGLEDASGGQVLVRGVSVHDPKTDVDALRSEIGMVFQRFNLFPHKTVLENITLAPTKVRGLTAAQARLRASELLDKVGLLDKMDAYPNQLSQAASSSAWPLHGHWPCSRASCCLTNPPRRWTPKWSAKYWPSCRRWPKRA